jgi:predicted component of type VI protein secretion system
VSNLDGLVKKIAKEDDLRFCRNAKKLKQVLKVVRLLLGFSLRFNKLQGILAKANNILYVT